MDLHTVVALILSGAIGISLGLLGGGGSILAVPVLVYVAGIEAKESVAMSLAIVGSTSLFGSLLHGSKGKVDLKVAATFGGAGIIGAYVGARLTHLVANRILLLLFAALMLVVAVAMLLRNDKHDASAARTQKRSLALTLFVGLGVGFLTGFLGVGGGFLVVPALVLFAGLPMRLAVNMLRWINSWKRLDCRLIENRTEKRAMKHLRRYSKRTQLLFGGLLIIASVLFLVPFQVEGQGRAHQKEKPQAVRSEMIVSTAWLAAHLNDPKVVVLHVARERAHFDGGHIPGARFVGWGEITATRDGVPNELAPVADLQKVFDRLGIGDDARIVLYGDNSGLSAARAYFTLDYLGHGGRAALLDGGPEKWKAERRAISTDAVEIKTARFTPRVRASAVTNLDVVRDLSWTAVNVISPSAVLIDARPVDEYTGAKPGDGVPRAGHIPGAANVFWMKNVVSKENPALRSPAELRRLYEEAGAAKGRTVVAYCRTGGQASHAYFTLKYLGFDVVMYDGSFFEWSNTEGTPVVAGSERK